MIDTVVKIGQPIEVHPDTTCPLCSGVMEPLKYESSPGAWLMDEHNSHRYSRLFHHWSVKDAPCGMELKDGDSHFCGPAYLFSVVTRMHVCTNCFYVVGLVVSRTLLSIVNDVSPSSRSDEGF